MLREHGRLQWQRSDWKAMTFGVLMRGCWRKREELGIDSGELLNPLWLGVSYSVNRLDVKSKGGWDGKVRSNMTGKYIYELVFTSHAFVKSLVL